MYAMSGAGDPGPQGHWLWTEIPGTLDTYFIGSEQWPDCYMYMEDNDKGNVSGFKGDPGLQGHWTVTDIGTVTIDGKTVETYVLATVKWPNWFIYMEDNKEGNIRGWNGDPGSQGHFIIEKAKD